jgi:hypothetical protein
MSWSYEGNATSRCVPEKEIMMEVLDLSRRKGLVVGIANEHSLAWAAAQHFRNAGGELAITYLNDKAKPFVEPLTRQINADIFLPCDVTKPTARELIRSDQGEMGTPRFSLPFDRLGTQG